MSKIIDSALEAYLATYRELIAFERVDNSVVLSFPWHLAANHRIEITVTDLGHGHCVISDSARTFGEVRAAGHSLTTQVKERLEMLTSLSGLRIVDSHLVLESSYSDLGASIQKFLEVTKTVGDVYLVHKQRTAAEDDLVSEVRTLLDSKGVLYRVHEKIHGEIEAHDFNLVVPPNGHPGLAVKILGGQNTHALAQIWGYKCDDIRRDKHNRRTKLALVYDVRYQPWSIASRAILENRADLAIPSDALQNLPIKLETQGVITSKRRPPRRTRP